MDSSFGLYTNNYKSMSTVSPSVVFILDAKFDPLLELLRAVSNNLPKLHTKPEESKSRKCNDVGHFRLENIV